MAYCPNCGNEVVDGADFCQKCGTKLKIAEERKEEKKKFNIKKYLIIAVVVVVLIIIIANMGDKPDYIATVKGVTLCSDYGLNATAGDVISKYINNVKWETKKDGKDVVYVTVTGLGKGTDYYFSIVFHVAGGFDNGKALITLNEISLNGTKMSDYIEIYYAMHLAYDRNYEDLSDLAILIHEIQGY